MKVKTSPDGGPERYFRRVGTARPSHMLYAAGVGAVVDLPNMSVLVQGLDSWDYGAVPARGITEDRLLASVREILGPQVTELRTPPWLPDDGGDPNSPAAHVGVPVMPFPQWLRCTACDRLGRIDDGQLWRFVNSNPRRPDLAKFVHAQCRRRKDPLAVPARFMLACPAGHLDEFPWVSFTHRGGNCSHGGGGLLTMRDLAGNVGPNVLITCECGAMRNMITAVGQEAGARLPSCRGRHPHLGESDVAGCSLPTEVRTLILGASNQWFAVSLGALHIPSESGKVANRVAELWSQLADIDSPATLGYALKQVPALVGLREFQPDTIWSAMQAHRDADGSAAHNAELRSPEYDVLTSPSTAPSDEDFLLRSAEVPDEFKLLIQQVVLVERLREVRAFVGFTRLDAPEWGDSKPARLVRLSRDGKPTWVPAAETRGEGVFIQLREENVAAWEARLQDHNHVNALHAAYVLFRRNRGRDGSGWPPQRYWLLHTLSHMLIRQMSLECGYSSASLAERIYAGSSEAPASGILIYTAASDSEGTLGGLVSLGRSERLGHLLNDAVAAARWCSSDPLCAEREPMPPQEFVNGAACHACLLISETSCERGNRFLDRSFVVPVGDALLAVLTQ